MGRVAASVNFRRLACRRRDLCSLSVPACFRVAQQLPSLTARNVRLFGGSERQLEYGAARRWRTRNRRHSVGQSIALVVQQTFIPRFSGSCGRADINWELMAARPATLRAAGLHLACAHLGSTRLNR